MERYSLPHFERLKRQSLAFQNALVGHLTSNTIVSHPVIATGLFPKKLPWSDEVYVDEKGLLGGKGEFYANLEIPWEQQVKLWSPFKNTLLGKVSGSPEKKFVVAQKHYAAFSLGAPGTDSQVLTLGPRRSQMPLKGWREPVGVLLSKAFTEPFGGRFFLDSNPSYGSDKSVYPFDGNRYAKGSDPKHLGGDIWVADALLTFFKSEPDWSAAFASFGALDKTLHAFGEHEAATSISWATENGLDLKTVILRADDQLGRILDYLEQEDLLKETLIVVTSDHGGQRDRNYHGLHSPEGNHLEYIDGKTPLSELPQELRGTVAQGNVQALVRDSSLRFYLKKKDRLSLMNFTNSVRKLPGVAEIFYRQEVSGRYHYIRSFRSERLRGASLEWAKQHHSALMQTMANQVSADVVVLLLDGTGYGFPGDHGGAQEWVQRIPLFIWSPNLRLNQTVLKQRMEQTEARLVDIYPMALMLLGLPPDPSLDGSSLGIEALIEKETFR